MPGLIEAHAHLSFCNNKELEEFPRIPVEEHVIASIENAKLLLTRASRAASARPPPSRGSTSC
jgi:imidazolonepropionase-like amidohydrolase